MRDVFEAIEKLSVVLGLRLENAVRKRGWAGKPVIGRFEASAPDRTIYPQRIELPLPRGHRALFLPDAEPAADGTSWRIQIKRNDGVVRRSWKDGLHIRPVEGGYQLFLRDEPLGEPVFKQLLDELAESALSGHALTIAKAYSSRFGAVPAEVFEVLLTAQYVEQLEQMHEAVLTGASQLDVQTELARLSSFRPAP
jgi:hypothetical protein